MRGGEVEDDYGTNPTHESTENRCRCNGYQRRTNRGERNECNACGRTTTAPVTTELEPIKHSAPNISGVPTSCLKDEIIYVNPHE
jgi:hypothetical protein